MIAAGVDDLRGGPLPMSKRRAALLNRERHQHHHHHHHHQSWLPTSTGQHPPEPHSSLLLHSSCNYFPLHVLSPNTNCLRQSPHRRHHEGGVFSFKITGLYTTTLTCFPMYLANLHEYPRLNYVGSTEPLLACPVSNTEKRSGLPTKSSLFGTRTIARPIYHLAGPSSFAVFYYSG